MTTRRPLFTTLSVLVALLFALGARPFLIHSIDHQLADASYNSADAAEGSGRMAGFALIAGQILCVGMGAAIGVVLAAIGLVRGERWLALRWWSLILNLVAAGLVAWALFPLWRSQ